MVTGSAGFIGSHLTGRLLSEGHEVVGVDCLTDYYSTDLKLLRLSDLQTRFPNFDHRQLDITDSRELESLHEQPFDVVFHLAAQPGVRLHPADYGLYYSHNLIGTANILKFATLHEVRRVIFASSSSVYGNRCTLPLSETESRLLPTSIYGTTKLATELLARGSSIVDGLITRGLRFFTVYGPMGRPDMAYFRLIAAALGQWEFTLNGGGQIRRDFTHVSDTVESICLLADELSSRSAGYHDIVNVGGGNTRSMSDLISSIRSLAGTSFFFRNANLDARDVVETEASFAYLQHLTGKRPSIQLEEGLVEAFEWAQQPEVFRNLRSWIESSSAS